MCWQTAAATWQILLLLKKKQKPNSVRSGWISSASQSSHSALLYFIYLISWSLLIYIHPSALASDLYSRASTRLFQHGLSVIAFIVTKRLTWKCKWKVRCVCFYKKKSEFFIIICVRRGGAQKYLYQTWYFEILVLKNLCSRRPASLTAVTTGLIKQVNDVSSLEAIFFKRQGQKKKKTFAKWANE